MPTKKVSTKKTPKKTSAKKSVAKVTASKKTTATKPLRKRHVKPGKVSVKKMKPAIEMPGDRCKHCERLPMGQTMILALLLGVIVSLSLVLLAATYTIKFG